MSNVNDTAFNYADFLKSSEQKVYNSYMNDSYIQSSGMTVNVFKLDKVFTKKSELYGSEISSRIYLPHFPIRALYNTNKWTGGLNLNIYEEVENEISITVNFDRMVNIHRELKNLSSGNIAISYSGAGIPFVKIKDNVLTLFVDNNIVIEKSLKNSDFNTIKKVVSIINTIPNFTSNNTGENEPSINLENINKASFKNITKELLIKDNTYANITDVIEAGDVVLTDKFRLYQVVQANPSGEIGWNYSTYMIKGGLCDLSLVDSLPNDYREVISKNQYGLGKIRKE